MVSPRNLGNIGIHRKIEKVRKEENLHPS